MPKQLSYRNLKTQAYIWLGFPVVLFLWGWMCWWVSVPLTAMLIWSLWQDLGHPEAPGVREEWQPVQLNGAWKVTFLLMPLILVVFGMGGFLPQHYDHLYRNAVFYDLVHHSWPVTYDEGSGRMLCYYFAYWLPSALVSKATGYILPGDLMTIVWTWWGLAIAYSLLVSRLGGTPRWWHLPFVLAFGFWDRLVLFLFTEPLLRLFNFDEIYDFFSNYMSFNLIEQLKMIYNQALPCWVSLPLIWNARNDGGRLLLPCALLFVFSPLPCVGISTAVAWCVLRNLRKSLTVANLTALLVITATGLFYMNNNNAASPMQSVFQAPLTILVLGISFYALAVGIYFPFVGKRLLKSPIFIIMAVTCFVLPFFSLGSSDDLGRRALIPLTIMITYCMASEISGMRIYFLARRATMSLVVLAAMAVAVNEVYEEGVLISHCTPGQKSNKLVTLMGNLDNREQNDCYDNFIAEGENFYAKYLKR